MVGIETTAPETLEQGECRIRQTNMVQLRSGAVVQCDDVVVGDPSDATPDLRALLRQVGDSFDAMLRNDLTLLPPQFSGGQFATNHATEWMYFGSEAILDTLPPDEGSMREWGSRYLPSASALGLFPMQRVPEAGRVFVDGFADARSQAIFANMLDCIAVRSRAAIFAHQVRVVADQVAGPMRCLSLGSGAAVPVIDALSALHADGRREYDLVLVDLDLGALAFAEQLAREADFAGQVRTVNDNIVRASRTLPHDHFHLVDLLGVWEYGSDRACASMIKSALAHVIPGGRIIVSNMLADRPQLHFNQRGVGWPSVKPRTIEQMVNIALRCGIEPERVQVSVAGDGVYGVMSITG